MSLNFEDYTRKLASLGRAITPELIAGTRDMIAPHLEQRPVADVKLQRDVRYGPDERHRLDIFTHSEDPSAERPLMVFIHGGGFVAGDKYVEGTPFYDNVGQWAVRNGFNAINMTYRLAPSYPWPAGIEDIHTMMHWLRSNAGQHGLSPDKVFLVGQSAGASHVASYIAFENIYAPHTHGITGMALLSGMYNFTSMPVDSHCQAYLGMDESTYGQKSSLPGLVETRVPMLVAVSGLDPDFFQAQSLELLTALQKKHGIMPETVYLSGQNHLSGILFLGLEGDLLGPQLKRFMEKHAA